MLIIHDTTTPLDEKQKKNCGSMTIPAIGRRRRLLVEEYGATVGIDYGSCQFRRGCVGRTAVTSVEVETAELAFQAYPGGGDNSGRIDEARMGGPCQRPVSGTVPTIVHSYC